MNNPEELQRTVATTIPVDKKNKIALTLTVVSMLAVGSIVLVNYPLETIIVSLFIGSVFVLDRK